MKRYTIFLVLIFSSMINAKEISIEKRSELFLNSANAMLKKKIKTAMQVVGWHMLNAIRVQRT